MEREKYSFSINFLMIVTLGIVFVLASFVIIFTVRTNIRKQALLDAEKKANIIIDRNLATHTYFSKILKPKLFDFMDIKKTPDYFEPSCMSSTFAVREIDTFFKSVIKEDYYYKECAVNARSPENEADDFEKAFIHELNSNSDLNIKSLIRKIDGKYFYVTMQRGEMMEESCLRCHSSHDKAPKGLVDIYGPVRSFNRKIGDVISAISIRVPLNHAYVNADKFSIQLSLLLLIIVFLAFTAYFMVYRGFIGSPIKNIDDKILNIINDDKKLGENVPLPLAKEIRNLTMSFNTMSSRLRSNMDTLEHQVDERTKDLQLALSEIKTLSGIIPICCYCKHIRDDKGYWNKVERYVQEHTDAKFTHSICPDCMQKHFPEASDEENL